MSQNIGVIGAGSWGTALARLLAGNGCRVRVWDLDTELIESIGRERENRRYLPGISIPEEIEYCREEGRALEGADIVLFAVPAQHFRSAYIKAAEFMPRKAVAVNVAKGIEQASLSRMSEIALSIDPSRSYVVLSGPSHAEEVGREMPTTVTAASSDAEAAGFIQDVFMNDNFRIYTGSDVAGLELGGALKNIIALGAGIADGLGYGDNAKAAMMTRGIVEMTRLGVKLGARPETFSGLSGVGDLIVTCCSVHSRNRRCGILIGKGMDPAEAVKEVGMVVEGMYTADAAYRLAKKLGVEMPITQAIYEVVNGKVRASDAVSALMTRPKKQENEHLMKELL